MTDQEPHTIAHLANGRPRLRKTARQTFIDEACDYIAEQRDSGRHSSLAFSVCGHGAVSGLEFQHAAGAFYDYVAFCPNDFEVDHKVGKRLVREAMRPRNGLKAMMLSPIFFLLASIAWNILWYFWTHRK